MKSSTTLFLAAGCLFLGAAPLMRAHHSFMAEFESKESVSIEGMVTKVDWENPHTFFTMDVKDKNGKIVQWTLETGSPNAVEMRGWTRDTLKTGDYVKVHGYRAK